MYGFPLDKTKWHKARREYMGAARACRDALTNQEGYWKYSQDDERVKNAVSKWVARARNAHAFAMGKKPVIENFVIVNGSHTVSGGVYAG